MKFTKIRETAFDEIQLNAGVLSAEFTLHLVRLATLSPRLPAVSRLTLRQPTRILARISTTAPRTRRS